MSEVILEVNNVETFVNRKQVSFTVSPGEVICLFGLNGAGKTVFLKTLCGIFKEKSGSVKYNIDISKRGVCLQFPEHLIFKSNVLSEALLITDNEERALQLISEINADKDMSPFYLSDGQKRLLFIYGILETKDIIFLDEPFVSLDDESKLKVSNKIKESAKSGKSIIYTANREVDKSTATKIIEL